MAPVAMQQGRYAAALVRARLRDSPSRPFRYRDKGNVATIGRARAVADLHVVRLSGFPAWITWLVVHLFNLVGFRNRLLVLISWAFNFVTRGRGARSSLRGATSASSTRWPARLWMPSVPPTASTWSVQQTSPSPCVRPGERNHRPREARAGRPRARRASALAPARDARRVPFVPILTRSCCRAERTAGAPASWTIATRCRRSRGPVKSELMLPCLESPRTYVDVATMVHFKATSFALTHTSR